jgi:hypothetical protein
MKNNLDIEAEGGELILKNKAGDHVIIPKNYRGRVQTMLKNKDNSSIDELVNVLPVMADYAQDGTVVPDEEPEFTPPPLDTQTKRDNTMVDVPVPLTPDKKQKNFEVRMNDPNQKSIPSGDNDGKTSTHKMMSFDADGKYYAAPTIVEKDGKLEELSQEDAMAYALKNNEYKEFKTEEEASKYAEGDYKVGTPMDDNPRRQEAFDLSYEQRERIYKTIPPGTYPNAQLLPAVGNLLYDRQRMDSIDELPNLEKKVETLRNSDDMKNYKKEFKELSNSGEYTIEKGDALLEKYNSPYGSIDKLKTRYDEITDGMGEHDEDMWRFYLGLPMMNENTVVESKYKPSKSKDPDAKYYSLNVTNEFDGETTYNSYKENILNRVLNKEDSDDNDEYPRVMNRILSGLANITIDKGEDENGKYISLYDVYDFGKPDEVTGKIERKVGKPYEIYDRIYYKKYKRPGAKGTRSEIMYYSDGELLKLNTDSKDYNEENVRKELSNRGASLGVNETTEESLANYQKKNKNK